MREWFGRRRAFAWDVLTALWTSSIKTLGLVSLAVGGAISAYAAFVSQRAWLVFVSAAFVVFVLMEAAFKRWEAERVRADAAVIERDTALTALDDRQQRRDETAEVIRQWQRTLVALMGFKESGVQLRDELEASRRGFLVGPLEDHRSLQARLDQWSEGVDAALRLGPPELHIRYRVAIADAPKDYGSLLEPVGAKLPARFRAFLDALDVALDAGPAHVTELENHWRSL